MMTLGPVQFRRALYIKPSWTVHIGLISLQQDNQNLWMELKTNIRPFYPWRPIRRIFTRRPQLQLHEKSITINNNMMPNLVFFLSDGVMELLCMRYLL